MRTPRCRLSRSFSARCSCCSPPVGCSRRSASTPTRAASLRSAGSSRWRASLASRAQGTERRLTVVIEQGAGEPRFSGGRSSARREVRQRLHYDRAGIRLERCSALGGHSPLDNARLHTLLERANPRPVHLVAHSYGRLIAGAVHAGPSGDVQASYSSTRSKKASTFSPTCSRCIGASAVCSQ